MHRRPRGWRAVGWSTAAVAGCTLLGLGAGGGTLAFFNDGATAPGGTVTAGTAQLRVNDAASAPLAEATLSPATPAALSFVVSNTGDAPLGLSATANTAGSLGGDALAALVPVGSAADCTAGTAGSRVPLSGLDAASLGTLRPGSSSRLCLVLGLAANTPVELSGTGFTYTLTITGRQVKP